MHNKDYDFFEEEIDEGEDTIEKAGAFRLVGAIFVSA